MSPDGAGWMPVRAEPFAALDPASLYAILRLRVDVFVVEQRCPYPEVDGRDVEPGTVHVWSHDDDGPTVYLRVLDDGPVRRIGRVCTRADARGRGLAGLLVRWVLTQLPPGPFVLDAQSQLAGWYAPFGFAVVGPEFVEDGIPHVPMRRNPTR